MKEQGNSIVANNLDELEVGNPQVIFMGSALIGLNLALMISISLYWINPAIHQFLSGKPL